MEEKQLGTETQNQKARSNDIGFVGYRDYKESELYQRYEKARSEMSQDALDELLGIKLPEKPHEMLHAFRYVCMFILALAYLALCFVGYIIPMQEDIIIGSVFGVFDGKDMVTALGVLSSGGFSDIIDIIGMISLTVSVAMAFFALLVSLISLIRKQSLDGIMKVCCGLLFLFTTVGIICVVARRLDITIGISALVILSGIASVIALTMPRVVKEKD